MIDTRFGYANRLMITDTELLEQVGLDRAPELEAAAVEYLESSPYAE